MRELSKDLDTIEDLVKTGQYSFFNIFGAGKYHELNKGNSYNTLNYNKEKYNLVDMWPDNYVYNLKGYNRSNIKEVIDKMKAKEIPNIIHIEDTPNNFDIIKGLEDNGLKMIVKYPAMYMDTSNIHMEEVNDNIDIRLVDSDELVLEWVKTINTVWGIGDKDKDSLIIDTQFKVYKELYQYRDKIRLYLGFYDDKPLSVNIMTF